MKTMRLLTVALWLSLSFHITPGIAAPPEPYSCRNGLFSKVQDALQLAEVTDENSGRLYFYKDVKGCPQKTEQCQDKAYVIRGDQLLINAVSDGWACAWFQGKKRETVGWVDVNGLKFLQTVPNQDTANWLGTWRFYDNRVSISGDGKSLRIDGEARWYGGKTGEVVHYGALKGEISPANSRAHLTTGDERYSCAADFTLIGKYLIISDNGNCGGGNVHFDGVYMKSR